MIYDGILGNLSIHFESGRWQHPFSSSSIVRESERTPTNFQQGKAIPDAQILAPLQHFLLPPPSEKSYRAKAKRNGDSRRHSPLRAALILQAQGLVA